MTMKTMIQGCVLAALMAAGVGAAHAETRTVLGLSITGGGDTLADGYFTDGTSWNVKAGGTIHFFGGAEFQQPDSNIAVQANIGYHVDRVGASNGSVSFSRYPAELLLLWQTESALRLGAGLRMAMSPKLTSSGAGYIGNYDFKADPAMVVQGEYVSSKRVSILLRYVKETYTNYGAKIDGSHVGLGVAFRL